MFSGNLCPLQKKNSNLLCFKCTKIAKFRYIVSKYNSFALRTTFLGIQGAVFKRKRQVSEISSNFLKFSQKMVFLAKYSFFPVLPKNFALFFSYHPCCLFSKLIHHRVADVDNYFQFPQKND